MNTIIISQSPKESTCLKVSQIPLEVNEDALARYFASIGPIAFIEIQRKKRLDGNGNAGLVAFMTNNEAKQALNQLNEKVFQGSVMYLQWADPITIPSRPVFCYL